MVARSPRPTSASHCQSLMSTMFEPDRTLTTSKRIARPSSTTRRDAILCWPVRPVSAGANITQLGHYISTDPGTERPTPAVGDPAKRQFVVPIDRVVPRPPRMRPLSIRSTTVRRAEHESAGTRWEGTAVTGLPVSADSASFPCSTSVVESRLTRRCHDLKKELAGDPSHEGSRNRTGRDPRRGQDSFL